MKAFALACLLGTIVAESPDCPESTQVFSYTEHVPAAAGFLQTSACHSAGVAGVNCLPNNQLFATGMNGDEDLAEDITMKGDKFHYIQKKSAFATGMNGDEDLAEDITMKGDKFHYVQRPEVLAQNGQAYYLPTCTETYTTNCQPVCDEGTTVGCTEARTPIPPTKDRFEGKYTWK